MILAREPKKQAGESPATCHGKARKQELLSVRWEHGCIWSILESCGSNGMIRV